MSEHDAKHLQGNPGPHVLAPMVVERRPGIPPVARNLTNVQSYLERPQAPSNPKSAAHASSIRPGRVLRERLSTSRSTTRREAGSEGPHLENSTPSGIYADLTRARREEAADRRGARGVELEWIVADGSRAGSFLPSSRAPRSWRSCSATFADPRRRPGQPDARAGDAEVPGSSRRIPARARSDSARTRALRLLAEMLVGGTQSMANWWTSNPEAPREQMVAIAMDFAWLGLERLSRGERWPPG